MLTLPERVVTWAIEPSLSELASLTLIEALALAASSSSVEMLAPSKAGMDFPSKADIIEEGAPSEATMRLSFLLVTQTRREMSLLLIFALSGSSNEGSSA